MVNDHVANGESSFDYPEDAGYNITYGYVKIRHPAFKSLRYKEDEQEAEADSSENNNVHVDEKLFERYKTFIDVKRDPRFNLDINKMNAVKLPTDLVQNLNLMLNFRRTLVGRSLKDFDETLTYIYDEKNNFKNLVKYNDGYLDKDSNYFKIDAKNLRESTGSTVLTNSRVILYWRGLTLTEKQIKRILTLGLVHLLGGLSEAELIFYIKEEVSSIINTHEIKLRTSKNKFVLIGIEEPIFGF